MTSSGQIVGESRRSKSLTQEELAERIGVSRQTIAISFKYLLAKTVLDFQFSDLPIPS